MARARAGEQQRPRSKIDLLQELSLGINKFQELLTAIHDFSQDGFPYRDAARSKAELKFRECLRQTFGERSQEFQAHRNFKIRTGDHGETAQSLEVIKGLMQALEDRKLELHGLKPTATTDSTSKSSPSPAAAHLELVPPPPPTPKATQTQPTAFATIATVTPTHTPFTPLSSVPPTVPEPVTPTPPSISKLAPPPIPVTVESSTHQTAASGPPPPATQGPSPSLSPPPPSIDRRVDKAQASTASFAVSPTSSSSPPPHIEAPAPETSPPMSSRITESPHTRAADNPSTTLILPPASEAIREYDALSLIRKVCQRFHSVARQLRLRKDYRPTIEVDDEYDLQDLLCAILKVEFDEVSTDDWTPPYTEGASRTTLLVNRDQIAIVAKKTGPGLTTKELTDQLLADAAHYRTQGRCSTLFCFVYDPEGRIGSPKRLETTLTSVSEHCRIEVLVAPK